MRAEQVASCTYWTSAANPPVEVQMTIRVEIPGEPGVDVSTTLLFEPELPEHLADMVHQKLYDGVHAGLGATGLPFPQGGIAVEILTLQLHPFPETIVADKDMQRIAEALGALVMGIVGALWAGLEASGNESSQSAST